MTTALLAFAVAVLTTLVATPICRRVAIRVGMLDRPAARKSHQVPTPYLGGVAIVAGVLTGVVVAVALSAAAGVVILAASLMSCVGLLDDDRLVEPRLRLLVAIGAACLVASVGVRLKVTGVPPIDTILTIVWIVGITNAVNFLDNMDGLAAGVAGTIGLATSIVAGMSGQLVVAALGASIAGAGVAFLAYNWRPATVFMGDAGSLFLGFLVAVLTLEVNPALVPPGSFCVPLLLAALPVLDISIVSVARLRRGMSLTAGGKVHLSHRLVCLGASPQAAVGVLIGVEAILGGLALAANDHLLSTMWAILIGAVVVAALCGVAFRAKVFDEPVIGFSRRLRLAFGAGVAVVLALAMPGVVVLVHVEHELAAGERAAERAVKRANQGDPKAAADDFHAATAHFAHARPQLDGAAARIGCTLPVLCSNLRAARTLSDVGARLSSNGEQLMRAAAPGALRMADGSARLDQVHALTPVLSNVSTALHEAAVRVHDMREPYLAPVLRTAADKLEELVPRFADDADRAAEAARVVPSILGEGGNRRYLLAFASDIPPDTDRTSIITWAVLSARDGHLTLQPAPPVPSDAVESHASGTAVPTVRLPDRPSPDFPTRADGLARRYLEASGEHVDGVILLDTVGLASLLDITGSVSVPGAPEPITSQNLLPLVRTQVQRTPVSESDGLATTLAATALQAFDDLTSVDVVGPGRLASSFGAAVEGRHVQVHLDDPVAERLMVRLGAAGVIPPVRSDSLIVDAPPRLFDAGGGGRRVVYDVVVAPRGSAADIRGKLQLRVPAESAPSSDPFGLRIYTPLQLAGAGVGGREIELAAGRDLGRSVYATPSVATTDLGTTFSSNVSGTVPLVQGGWYVLDLVGQPSFLSADAEVTISAAPGWKIAEAIGVEGSGRRASAVMPLAGSRTVMVRLQRSGLAGVWERLGEWR